MFTSINGNSIGGATGTGTPTVNDWAGIYPNGAGSADIEHATIEYANIAIKAGGTGAVACRGSFLNDGMDVQACAWAGQCSVDATYSYWGSAAGPSPVSGPPLACGAVTTSP